MIIWIELATFQESMVIQKVGTERMPGTQSDGKDEYKFNYSNDLPKKYIPRFTFIVQFMASTIKPQNEERQLV
jgi:hypothetical protein